jgi:hypothetical protein
LGTVTKDKGEEMKQHSVNTWLPVFPGFYATMFEPYDSRIAEEMALCISQHLHDNDSLADLLQGGEVDLWRHCDFDNEGWQSAFAPDIVDAVNEQLGDIPGGPCFTFQKVHSPREYNFTNDSINVTLAFEDLSAFTKYLLAVIVSNSGKFTTYLSRYTSGPGFISHYSDNAAEWVKEIESGEALDDQHKSGALVDFLLFVAVFDHGSLYWAVEAPNECGYITTTADTETLKRLESVCIRITRGKEDFAKYAALMRDRSQNAINNQLQKMQQVHRELLASI